MADDELLTKICSIEKKIETLTNKKISITMQLKLLEKERDDLKKKYNAEKSKKISEVDWISPQFPWSDEVLKILNQKFHIDSFRPKQLAAINATLSKKDVLLLMPTGGGKSLTYQLPIFIDKGITLVISPLLSLIEDQLMSLEKLNIEATSLNSTTPKEKKNYVLNCLKNGINCKFNLLYVTPEWLAKSKLFMSNLEKCYASGNLKRIAIDEVHCCSQWGHDFRPDYNYLHILKEMFPNVPIIGLTATATMSVLHDVQNMLSIEGCTIIKAPFNRPNLYYNVINKQKTFESNVEYIEKLLKTKYKQQSGIIYTTTIKDSEELTHALKEKNIKVKCYHANLEPERRKSAYEKWVNNSCQVVVATIAFGMGIDKPDVRYVIHHAMPKSMEGLYQESGRAGRDNKPADCILMYSLNDYFRNSSMTSSKTENEKLHSVLEYCLNYTQCRRTLLASYFEDSYEDTKCECCDYCCNNDKETVLYDITSACLDIYKILDNAEKNEVRLTLIKLTDSWFQTGIKNLRVNTIEKPKFKKEQAEIIIGYLLMKGFLKIDKSYSAYAVNCYIKKNYINLNNIKIEMSVNNNIKLSNYKKRKLDESECDELRQNSKCLKSS